MTRGTYYAGEPAPDLAKKLLMKIDSVRASRRSSDFARRLHRNWLQYYGLNDWKASLSDNLYAEGPAGERVALRVNHLRNVLLHIQQLVTSNRPMLKAKAENMDVKSLKQVQLGDGIVEHYFEFENVWKYIDVALEQSLFLHAGFVAADWDPSKGEPWAAMENDDGSGAKIAYQGEFEFWNPSMFDVIFDQMSSSWDELNDVMVRKWMNKYDAMATWPAEEETIDKQRTRKEWEIYDSIPLVFFQSDDSNQIEIHHYYHKRTRALPQGRMMRFLSDGTVLADGPLGYAAIPVFRVTVSEIMGAPHGWCPATDLAPLQEAIDKLASTICTNQFAFGVSNIWAPRGSRIEVAQLSGGLNLLEGSPVGPNGGKPEVLNLLSTPKEIFDFLEILIKSVETLSGVNEVVRGNPQPGLTAGVALALVQTQSLSFMGPLQRSYGECARDLARFIVNTLKDNATTPRLLHIVGEAGRESAQYFQGGDIDGVNRIDLEIGNPMLQTPAGRMQFAQMLIESGAQLNVNQLMEVWDKGRLDPLTKANIDQLDLILLENEDLRNGIPCPVLAGDDDVLHLRMHFDEANSPEMRRNIILQQALLQHMNAHVAKYMQGDMLQGIISGMIPPGFLAMLPQAPPGGPGGGGGGGKGPSGPQGPQANGRPLGQPPPSPGGVARQPPPAKGPSMDGVPVPNGVMPPSLPQQPH